MGAHIPEQKEEKERELHTRKREKERELHTRKRLKAQVIHPEEAESPGYTPGGMNGVSVVHPEV